MAEPHNLYQCTVGNGLDRSEWLNRIVYGDAAKPFRRPLLMLCVAAKRANRREYEWLRRVTLSSP
ncbi:MAG: hypothetical protein RSD01_04740 [Ruthenibacterium sp.]